jgi:hypothetical protein
MSAGDLCRHSDGTTSTAAQMLGSQHAHGWFPFLTGLVLLLCAALVVMWPRRPRG